MVFLCIVLSVRGIFFFMYRRINNVLGVSVIEVLKYFNLFLLVVDIFSRIRLKYCWLSCCVVLVIFWFNMIWKFWYDMVFSDSCMWVVNIGLFLINSNLIGIMCI